MFCEKSLCMRVHGLFVHYIKMILHHIVARDILHIRIYMYVYLVLSGSLIYPQVSRLELGIKGISRLMHL